MFRKILFICSLIALLIAPVWAMDDVPDSVSDRLVGDIGVAAYATQLNIGQLATQTRVLPYAFFDYQRFFARIDTVGIKTVPLGYGHVELVGRIMLNNYNINSTVGGGALSKSNPVPVGIGTFQETPIGGFFINAFHDFGPSQGAMYEIQYFAEIKPTPWFTLYPLAGIERLSAQFANYYYGLSAGDALQTGYTPYNAAATNNLMAGMLVEIPLFDQWVANVYAKRKWMGSGINNSPVMTRSFQDNGFIAIAYRFK